jgi:hypothetical protein
LRAGLLSQPNVIEEINDKFVSTWIIIDDANRLAESGEPLAKTLVTKWEYPITMMFLTPEGKFVSSLNSFKDFKDVHPDVAAPPGKFKPGEGEAKRSHVEVFMDHVRAFFQAGRAPTS